MVKLLELFGGIGACSKALDRLGIDYKIEDYVEIDKFAVKSFNAIHGTDFVPQDICEWDKSIEVDLIMHGSPCQDFSLAGKQAGGDEGSGTRSSLMYETIRIVNKLKPKYVIWENVKNILSQKHKHNFETYLNKMNELGYINYYQVLNAKDYGIPQNRERVFTISIRKDIENNFEFPKKQELKLKLKDMLEDEVDEKYYCDTLCARDWKDPKCIQVSNKTDIDNPLKGISGKSWQFEQNVYSENSKCTRALKAGGGSGNIPKIMENKNSKCIQVGNLSGGKWDKINESCRRIYDEEGISPTIHTCQGGNTEPKVLTNYIIRKLIPKECWRLMGFDDEDFEKAEKVNSNTQLYKQARKLNLCKCFRKNIK